MAVQVRTLLANPSFLIGLGIRLLLIVCALPLVRSQWFIPFLQTQLQHLSINPWQNYLNFNGDPKSFPYGTVMFLVFFPGVILGNILQTLGSKINFINIGIGLVVLTLDVCLMWLLQKITTAKINKVINYYWLSPIIIYICYWHGQLDILPVTLLIATLYVLKLGKPHMAGALLAASISAKLSMLLAVPVLIIFLWRNNRLRFLLKPFLTLFLLVFAVIQLPYFFTNGFATMVFENPEFGKVGLLALNFNGQAIIYLLPIAYVLFIYGLWRLERMSYNLLYALLGIGFFLILIFTPASIGWYLWIVPFIVIYQINSASKLDSYLVMVLSWLFVLGSFYYYPGAILNVHVIALNTPVNHYNTLLNNHEPWWTTGVAMLLSVLCLSMYIKGIRNNDYFRLSRKPLTIGIAGDSGSGKDTLSGMLAGLFHSNAVTSISGDDYHKWDRYAPMWKVLTHLDPRANKLQQFQRDIFALIDGKSILARHYDHATGRFTKALSVHKNDVILVSGLHVLYLPQLRDKFDVKIYLQMDETLRKFFKLRRDVLERGHTEERVYSSLERRMPDAEAYLYPQADYADIIFILEPAKPVLLKEYTKQIDISLRLRVIIKHAFYYEELTHLLVGLFGMWVNTNFSSDGDKVELLIDGDISADDIAMAAHKLVPQMDELLDLYPNWQGGVAGIMQLIVLMHTAEALHARLI